MEIGEPVRKIDFEPMPENEPVPEPAPQVQPEHVPAPREPVPA